MNHDRREEDDGLRIRSVLLSGLVAVVLCYLLLRWWSGQGRALPQNSWVGVVLVLVIGAVLLSAAWQVRSVVRGGVSGRRPPSPQFSRGVLVGARAAAVAGGVAGGWYLAQVLVRLPNIGIDTQRSAALLALLLALVCAALAVAGLVAQAWCRLPPEDDDEHPPRSGTTIA